MSIETMGNYIIEGRKMSDKKLLSEIKKLRQRIEKLENRQGPFGFNPYKDKLSNFNTVAFQRGLLNAGFIERCIKESI